MLVKFILSLECYANVFVKIVQECRGTISHLKGYFYSKLRNLVNRNLGRIQLALQELLYGERFCEIK